MLTDLFEEVDAGPASVTPGPGSRTAIVPPLPPRRSTRLAGIYNLGATCYLNSLLQTLLMTPEFREALFMLGPEELGRIEDADKPSAKTRIIPLQLQRLFGRLLLLDAQGVNTTELTDSFGWTGSEAFQQHDAQELNRILFSAMEDSLVGTEGQRFIQHLYHGTIVNQIICEECGNVVEREEDFLDVCVALGGATDLEHGLADSFGAAELLCGPNQYRCERCQRLVNAKKGSKFRHLPPILTISLLRFSFDFQKMERYKETGKFAFPMELDLGKFCEDESADTVYDLFSVVIHRGSTHGGHYHSYIRDVDALGHWTHPDEEEIVIPTDPATGKVDYIELDSPVELLYAILSRSGEHGLMVDRLCAELVKQTGVSWNKRFKKLYGPINKFLKKYDDKFVYNPASNWVSLKVKGSGGDYSSSDTTVEHHGMAIEAEAKETTESDRRTKRPTSPSPEPGCCWFNFDDAQVRPIRTQELETQFSGKESAYMLFYRKKSMTRPVEACGIPSYCVPDRLIEEVTQENITLSQQRLDYEEAANTIVIEVHFSRNYTLTEGALHPVTDSCHFMELSIDRRKMLVELRAAIMELGGEIVMQDFVLHTAKSLPAGLHLYNRVSGDDASIIQSLGIVTNHTKLFVWNGKQVRGEPVATGNDCEPVVLNIVSGNPTPVCERRAYPKNLTVGGLKCILAEMTGVQAEDVKLSRLVTRGKKREKFRLFPGDDVQTLCDLKVDDGDTFVIGDATQGDTDTNRHVNQSQKHWSFTVENRCGAAQDGIYPVLTVEVDKDATIEGLKTVIMMSQTTVSREVDSRLRVDDSDHGLTTPLHEQQTLSAAGLQTGMRLVWELGQAPRTSQITLTFTPNDPTCDMRDLEVVIEKQVTVEECLNLMIATASCEGDKWHLRQTNWCREAADILDDLTATLEQCHLRDGDHLLLERGKLPPKGFLKLSIWLHPAPSNDVESKISAAEPGINGTTEQENVTELQTRSLGEVIISKESTLDDLKQQIMTLPKMIDAIPTPRFLRVRLIENGHLGTVLRLATQSLQRLKVMSSSALAVQKLEHEENLDGNQVVLNLLERVPGSRTYQAPREFVWNLGRGADPVSLRQSIADFLVKPFELIVLAKHFHDKHMWLVIKDGAAGQKNVRRPKQQKSKKKGHNKLNVRLAPYHISDGDEIGVKDLQSDPLNSDDFGTDEDDVAKARQQMEAEEKKKRKALENQQRRTAVIDLGGSGDRKRKTEMVIWLRQHGGHPVTKATTSSTRWSSCHHGYHFVNTEIGNRLTFVVLGHS
ncbi:Ubiquitin carboxyl-terminal hydrolase 40 [Lamellibrachia satsuma]|nr:Ubiquitin carboxyl-terminal hydrolase 40 [Lamellibrachia satsuma]